LVSSCAITAATLLPHVATPDAALLRTIFFAAFRMERRAMLVFSLACCLARKVSFACFACSLFLSGPERAARGVDIACTVKA
jgi:hypothetical protein